MKILIQRVLEACVEVEGSIVGSIGPGLLVFVGVAHTDTLEQAQWLAKKLVHLRMFEDEEGKVNRSLIDEKGAVLAISQFTLYADCNEGRRPSFIQAARPEPALKLYEQFVEEVRKEGVPVETGVFGALMKVSLVNNGPFTLIVERNK
ncbi:MAG: D-tyrosyl-tRNA(Tyr) deacylase [Verrucomicrobia bacterium]|nr:D-tyrosyl-tRNA(Tyr) deacylase [Verrucomicrobiota bacterium]